MEAQNPLLAAIIVINRPFREVSTEECSDASRDVRIRDVIWIRGQLSPPRFATYVGDRILDVEFVVGESRKRAWRNEDSLLGVVAGGRIVVGSEGNGEGIERERIAREGNGPIS
jgi:hypothetical protein